MKPQNRFNPRLELLDGRSLLSVTLVNGLLTVVGTPGADQIYVGLSSPTQLRVENFEWAKAADGFADDETFDLSEVTGILIRARGGDDGVRIDPKIMIPTEVRGWSGNDTIYGGGGKNTLLGGGGDDQITGGPGSNTIFGQAGNDVLTGGAGNDTIFGDSPGAPAVSGNDLIDGMAGNDVCDGGAGNDSVYGGEGNDAVFGGIGNDTCSGGLGDDMVNGGGGDNSCSGGGGNDSITNGKRPSVELSASFGDGFGGVSFAPSDGGNGSVSQTFDVIVHKLHSVANGDVVLPVMVSVDGVGLGGMIVDQFGDAEFRIPINSKDYPDYPAGLPVVHAGSVVTVVNGDGTTLRGTLA